MTLRSPAFAALAVLFVAVAAVFVLVSEAGVETRVFTADPTSSPVPTVGPSPTPLPDASADNWVEVGTNQYQYRGDIAVTTNLTVSTSVLSEFVNASGLQPPPEDAAFPVFVLMTELRDLLTESATTNNIALEPEAISGPAIEVFGNVPVTMLRVRAQPQTLPSGTEYPGAELVFAWFQNAESLVRVEYEGRGAPNPVIYNDLRAWLEANVPELAGVVPAEEPTPEANGEGEPTEEPAVAEPTEVPTAVEPAETPATTPAPEELAVTATPIAAAPAEGGQTTAAEDMPAAEPVAAEGPWVPRGESMWQHASDPSAVVATGSRVLSEVATQIGYAPPQGEDLTIDALLAFQQGLIIGQMDAAGEQVTAREFDGPGVREVEGVSVAYLAYSVTISGEGTSQSQYTFLGLIPTGPDTVSGVTFQYFYSGERSAAIEADFDTWLADHVAELAVRTG